MSHQPCPQAAQPPTTFSLFSISRFTPPAPRHLIPSPFRTRKLSSTVSSINFRSFSLFPSSSLRFSPRGHQFYDGDCGEEEEEEPLVIGDCLVFEEGVFEDPYLYRDLDRDPKKSQTSKPTAEVEPENLIPDKWREVQEEINITKRERRKLAHEMEFGRRLEKKKMGLRPLGFASAEEFRTAKLAQLKPVILDNPRFPVKEDAEDERVEKPSEGRVPPRNPKLVVYGATLNDVAQFLNSGDYDPDAARKSKGSRKLFTKEEKVLLNRRVPDLAAATSGKWQPLHSLAASGEFNLVNALLKHNVDINILDKDGLTALHRAIIGKKQAIFNLLLRESANPFVRDEDGATLMHYAVLTASSHMIKILLLYNVDINLLDSDGWSPLHLAVQSRRTDIVRLLLIKGADKTLRNQDGLRPLDLCLYSGRDARTYQLIRLLKQLPRPR